MTLMQKVDDFGYQDFLVVPVAQGDVLPALARSLGADAAEAGIFDAASYSPPFLFRLLMRAMGMGVAAGRPPRLAAPTAPPDPDMVGQLAVHMMFRGAQAEGPFLSHPASPAFGAAMQALAEDFDDIRISGVAGQDRLAVVEMRDLASGISMTGLGLSVELAGVDVLYFRRSGAAAAEKKYDFHLYRDGGLMRRVLCHATWPHGTSEDEWWEGTSDGPLTRYEPAGLYDGASGATLLDNGKIDAILASFGLDAERLFGPGGRVTPVLFAKRAGGEPLPR